MDAEELALESLLSELELSSFSAMAVFVVSADSPCGETMAELLAGEPK